VQQIIEKMGDLLGRFWWGTSFIIKLGVAFPFLLAEGWAWQECQVRRERAEWLEHAQQVQAVELRQSQERKRKALVRRYSSDDGLLSIELPVGQTMATRSVHFAIGSLEWATSGEDEWLVYGNEEVAPLERQGVRELRSYLQQREAWLSPLAPTLFTAAQPSSVDGHDGLVVRTRFRTEKGEEPGALVVARGRQRFHWFILGASRSHRAEDLDAPLGWIERASLHD
jgi:hypothetical protein